MSEPFTACVLVASAGRLFMLPSCHHARLCVSSLQRQKSVSPSVFGSGFIQRGAREEAAAQRCEEDSDSQQEEASQSFHE